MDYPPRFSELTPEEKAAIQRACGTMKTVKETLIVPLIQDFIYENPGLSAEERLEGIEKHVNLQRINELMNKYDPQVSKAMNELQRLAALASAPYYLPEDAEEWGNKIGELCANAPQVRLNLSREK